MSDENASTEWGSWPPRGYTGQRPEESMADFLGEFIDDYDMPGLVTAYVAAINAALPNGVTLHGHLFFGPDPKPHNARNLIEAAVFSVDFGALAQQFDQSGED